MKVKELKIKKRLLRAFRIVIGVFTVASALVLGALLFMVKDYNRVLDYYAFPQGDIGQAMHAVAESRSATRAIIGYETQELINEVKGQRQNAIDKFLFYMKRIRPTMITKEGIACIETIDRIWSNYIRLENEIAELGATIDREKRIEAQNRMIHELTPLYNELDQAMNQLMEVNVQKGQEEQEVLQRVEQYIFIVLILAMAAIVFLAGRIAAAIAESIEVPLKEMEERLRSFVGGDISSPFPNSVGKDEIADIIRAGSDMAVRLREILFDTKDLMEEMAKGNFNIASRKEAQYVGEFKGLLDNIMGMNLQMSLALEQVEIASVQVSSGANHLADAAQDLAEGALDQAATVEEMQQTINMLSKGIRDTSIQLDQSYQQAQMHAKTAEDSRTDMENLMGAMGRISDASEKIGNIIGEIEDIASQTNLLSLNASIEAARAGEAGRGFAVVADQIRTLAEQSARSAVDSRKLIEDSLSQVADGNRVAINASKSLQEVVTGVHSLADSARLMRDVASEQALAMEQADEGINRIAEVVEANSATAQEASATSQELTAQADNMRDLVGRFTLRG